MSVELMRQLVKNHADLETKLDLEGVMATLIDNPIYEFHPTRLRLTGKNLIRHFYRDHFETFFPLTKKHIIDYTEENPAYRKAADKCFKKIYRDDLCDVFPKYGHPKIIEIWGDRLTRVKKLESYL